MATYGDVLDFPPVKMYIQLMTKEEAAEALGVSLRTLERYAAQGLLTLKYKKGARGKTAYFSEREVKTLKKQISAGEIFKPVARVKRLTTPFYYKLTLSLEEASALSGFPQEFLEQAIQQGNLKVVKRGEEYYIKRWDLEDFVRGLS
jgi:hypothetical protein